VPVLLYRRRSASRSHSIALASLINSPIVAGKVGHSPSKLHSEMLSGKRSSRNNLVDYEWVTTLELAETLVPIYYPAKGE